MYNDHDTVSTFLSSILGASDSSTSASLLKEIFDSEEVYHKKLEAEAKVRHLLKTSPLRLGWSLIPLSLISKLWSVSIFPSLTNILKAQSKRSTACPKYTTDTLYLRLSSSLSL